MQDAVLRFSDPNIRFATAYKTVPIFTWGHITSIDALTVSIVHIFPRIALTCY
jgi:hypothetical protein